MKNLCISIILLLSVLTFSSKSYSQDETPIPDGPLLGQTPAEQDSLSSHCPLSSALAKQ
ncbi:MAG: hypothetical protein OQK04_18965 [Kangiellaceae bacterium]|nr:hypothetical protein [Kangiellaceae bacterium]MCW9000799.1 hypothetical protein [Kangiellaceae bacterium]